MRASDELRAEWRRAPVAANFLEAAGYRLTAGFRWIIPDNHEPTAQELRAAQYLIEEWEYGEIIQGTKRLKG